MEQVNASAEDSCYINPAFVSNELKIQKTFNKIYTCDNNIENQDGSAVIVKNAIKSYGTGRQVLSGLSMTVPCGSIYGLLGSSGCGKTTLLSCILGLKSLDQGHILVFDNCPKNPNFSKNFGRHVGYMPQETSLYLEFSVKEMLQYFGKLCGLSCSKIKSEITFLCDLLKIPDTSQRISQLSGGQQRRVSFALALIHNPELLILDEPTVGVDPVIRASIWTHLRKLVLDNKTTVIITTHYIEEAGQADTIGMMRNGKLLVEKSPSELASYHGNISLEQCVLQLCKQDTNDTIEDGFTKMICIDCENPANNEKHYMAKIVKKNENVSNSFMRIGGLTWKNFMILFRNFLLLSFVIWVPAFNLAMMGFTLGNDPANLPLGVVNNEVLNWNQCENKTVAEGECNIENLSCYYLNYISTETVNLVNFDTKEDAEEATHKGTTWGYVVFNEKFSELFYDRVTIGNGDVFDDELFNKSQIIVRLDESNEQNSGHIKVALFNAFMDFIENFLQSCGYDRRLAESPLKYKNPIFGKSKIDYREYLAPGAGVALVFFFPIISTAIRYIKEKNSGMLERSLMTGTSTLEIMVACSVSEFCVLFTQAALCFGVFTGLFQIQIVGSHLTLAVLFLLSGYCGVAIGFVFGVLCTEEITAVLLIMAAFFPNFVISGLIWPVEGMPIYFQYVTYVLPCTFASEAARSIVSRGWDISHENVWPGFAILVGYTIACFMLIILFLRIKK